MRLESDDQAVDSEDERVLLPLFEFEDEIGVSCGPLMKASTGGHKEWILLASNRYPI